MRYNEWSRVKFGDIIISVSDTFKSDYKEVVLINTSDIHDGKVLNHELVRNENLRGQFKKSFRFEDILYSEIRPINRRFAYIDFDSNHYVASTKLMVLRKISDDVDTKFLFHILKSDKILKKLQTIAESRSGTFPQITFSELSRLEISLPSKIEQVKIANILSSIENKIEVNNKIIEIIEEMAQTIFTSWFIYFEPFRDGEFENSEIGLIPKKWRVGKITSLGEVASGSTPSKARKEFYSKNGIAWITPKDLSLTDNIFISKGAVDITNQGLKSGGLRLLPKGSILMSSRAPIGYIAISKNEITTNQGFKSVIPYQEFGSEFVYLFLKNNIDNIKSWATGSTFMEISGSSFKSIPALIPDKKVLKEFKAIVEPFFNKIEKLEEEINLLKKIRDSLLPKLMSGEIRVPLEEITYAEIY